MPSLRLRYVDQQFWKEGMRYSEMHSHSESFLLCLITSFMETKNDGALYLLRRLGKEARQGLFCADAQLHVPIRPLSKPMIALRCAWCLDGQHSSLRLAIEPATENHVDVNVLKRVSADKQQIVRFQSLRERR